MVPDYGAVLGEVNPFPVDDPRHGLWDIHRTRVAAEVAELYERVLALPQRPWAQELAAWKELCRGLFDIRARALMALIQPDKYGDVLADHVNAIIGGIENERLPIEQDLLPHIRTLLAQRHAHWVAQMLKARAAKPDDSSNTRTHLPEAALTQTNRLSSERLLSVQETAKRLAIHEDTVRRMQDRGEIQFVKIGNRRRVPASEIKRLHDSGNYPKRRT